MNKIIVKAYGNISTADGITVDVSKEIVHEFSTYSPASEFMFTYLGHNIDGKSILGLISLAAEYNQELYLAALIDKKEEQRLLLFLETFLQNIKFKIIEI